MGDVDENLDRDEEYAKARRRLIQLGLLFAGSVALAWLFL